MPGSTTRSRDLGRRPYLGRGSAERTWPVWAALVLGPAAWALAIGASYVLVPVACDLGTALPLHGVRAATTAVALGTASGAYGVWRTTRGGDAPILRRTSFLAFLGVVVAGFSALLIVVEGVANFVVSPCR